MTTDIRMDLGWVFAVWLVIANALWWWGPAGLERLFGPGQLWAALIPLACLAALYPRRAAGLVISVGATLLRPALTLLKRRQRRPQATSL